MFRFSKKALIAAMATGLAAPAFAADLYEPPIEEAPPIVQEVQYGGWYIRGDVDYHWSKFRGAEYMRTKDPENPGTFDYGKLKGALSLGGGVGYQINQHLRTDVTLDWMAKSNFRGGTSGTCGDPLAGGGPCTSTDKSSYSALLLLANAYVDLGTWYKITPYIGGGIGGARVKWDKLDNTICDDPTRPGCYTTTHNGGKGWRFAYALMAGASYCLTDKLDVDVGYRYSHINGGKMFGYRDNGGPGFDKGLDVHEVRGGLRYSFGGNSNCSEPVTVAYEPEPIYTK